MNEDVINDLKQFIAVTVSQQTLDLREDIEGLHGDINKLDQKIGSLDLKLSTKIDNLADFVSEAMTTSNEEVDKQLKDHESRLSHLETKVT